MKLEHHKEQLASPRTYAIRQLTFLFAAMLFIALSLSIGIWGYMHYGHLRFVDALLNASMIMGGMGPVDILRSDDAKVFASLFALYSGIALLTTVAVILTPMVHRLLHRLHLEQKEED
jgi:hypothetical protein